MVFVGVFGVSGSCKPDVSFHSSPNSYKIGRDRLTMDTFLGGQQILPLLVGKYKHCHHLMVANESLQIVWRVFVVARSLMEWLSVKRHWPGH